MSDAWRSLKIKQFEHVTAGPSLALLRVTGKAPRRRTAAPEDRPTLLADDGQSVTRFAALPSPPDDRGVLRAAYSVPAAVVKPETVFSLELGDGHAVLLPPPVKRAGGRQPQPVEADRGSDGPVVEADGSADPPADASAGPPAGELGGEPTEAAVLPPPSEGHAEIGSLRREVADANRRAEDALLDAAAAHDQREALERRNAELGESLRERQGALDELEVWRAELERRLASMSTELGDATARLRAAEQAMEGGRHQPAEAEARDDGEAAAERTGPTPEALADLDELRRLAAGEASEVAARELAEAAGEPPEPGL